MLEGVWCRWAPSPTTDAQVQAFARSCRPPIPLPRSLVGYLVGSCSCTFLIIVVRCVTRYAPALCCLRDYAHHMQICSHPVQNFCRCTFSQIKCYKCNTNGEVLFRSSSKMPARGFRLVLGYRICGHVPLCPMVCVQWDMTRHSVPK